MGFLAEEAAQAVKAQAKENEKENKKAKAGIS